MRPETSRHVFFTDRNLGKRLPQILRDAGLRVEQHDDHFAEKTPDLDWIPTVASHGWIAVSRDKQIRHKPDERAAVVASGLRLLVIGGKTPMADLAALVVSSMSILNEFIDSHPPPFIVTLRPPSPSKLARRSSLAGTIHLLLG